MIIFACIAFVLSLLGIAYYVKTRGAKPLKAEPDQHKIDDIFSVASKREEIRIIEIRARVAEAQQEAEAGNPEAAREQLKNGWGKARGE